MVGKKHPDAITAMEGLAIIDRGSECKDREAGLQSMPFNSLNTQGSVQQDMASNKSHSRLKTWKRKIMKWRRFENTS
jgi:hypothetical protein